MYKVFIFSLALALAAFGSLAAQTQLFNQPYAPSGSAYPSTYSPSFSMDNEVADNFNGLTEPITSCVFYGVTGIYDDGWTPAPPNPVEPFFIKFYAYEEELVTFDHGAIAPATGTYTVRLFDSFGDGWYTNTLDVYVNGILALDDITLADGYGPQDYTFSATAGDNIVTVYYSVYWGYENWYQILDPALNVIAQDGDNTQAMWPTGLGYLPLPAITAPATGTYTVNLYDGYGDGWDRGRMDVYVNNVLVLNNISVASGTGPAVFTFAASVGDQICTVYTGGDYPEENWYEIFDPDLVEIAQDGDGSTKPTGFGSVTAYLVLEPAWASPVHSWILNATATYQGTWTGWGLYKFAVDLPIPVDMATGWFSAQINCPGGSGQWFLWVDSSVGDRSFHQHTGGGKANPLLASVSASGAPKGELTGDMSFELWNDDGILPVELSSFTALLNSENDVCLNWTTQSETNVSGYYVLRNTSDDAASAIQVSPLIAGTNTSEQHHYSFTDSEACEPGTYYYWLQNTDFGGGVETHGPVSVNISETAGEVTPELPVVTALQSIYPNPFNPNAIIPFSVAKTATVEIKVFNARGQLMRHFGLAERAPGNYQIAWDGKDASGRECGSGVYYFVMRAGSETFQRKAIMLK